MSTILSDNKYDYLTQNIKLPIDLQNLIDSGFRTEQDCILLKDSVYFGPGELKSDFDKCSYEDFLNDIHVYNYISNVKNEFEYLKIGVEAGKQLYLKLKESFANNFRLTIYYNESTYANQGITEYGVCVIRFYTIRQSCEDKFRVDDLDVFKTEAVMVIE